MSDESLTNRAFRLHPLSIPYRLFQQGAGLLFLAVVVGAPAFGMVADMVGSTLTAALGLLAVVGVVGYAVAYYRRFEYELTPDTFDIRYGVLARRDREIPLHRIQNVDLSQNLLQRTLSLTEVRLETAGASGAEAQLKFVSERRAGQLQREISRLRRSNEDQQPEAEFDTVFEMTDRELGLLALVSVDMQFLPILFFAGSVFFPAVSALNTQVFFGYESVLRSLFGPLLSLLALVVVGVAYGLVNATLYYGFTLNRAGDELRYERGLLQKYSGTIPVSKIQTLTISENVLARVLGYASLEIETAGQAGGQGNGTTQSAIPIAERPRVLELTNSIEAVGEIAFERPPKRARQRYAARYSIGIGLVSGVLYLLDTALGFAIPWWAPLGLLVLVPLAAHLKWRNRGYYAGENHVVTRNGFWVRELKIVPYYRVQTVLSTETVFQRRRHLGTVTVDTAGSRSLFGNDAKAVDVDKGTAERLREQVSDDLYASLRTRARSNRSGGKERTGRGPTAPARESHDNAANSS